MPGLRLWLSSCVENEQVYIHNAGTNISWAIYSYVLLVQRIMLGPRGLNWAMTLVLTTRPGIIIWVPRALYYLVN